MCKLHIANCESELYKMHITKNNSPVNTNPHIPRFCNNFIHQSGQALPTVYIDAYSK